MITLSAEAPNYLHQMVAQLNAALANNMNALPVFTLTTLPTATDARWLRKFIFISNGVGNKFVAVSNGTAWYYLEGTAV